MECSDSAPEISTEPYKRNVEHQTQVGSCFGWPQEVSRQGTTLKTHSIPGFRFRRGGGGEAMMQLHISPSMRSITISSSKVAARHISYRTLFHTILILAFLLPFVFILTALVTLEGANKCSSIDCLGRRLGPRLLGRVDDSERLARDFYKILNEASTQDIPDGLKLPDSFNHLVSDTKNNHYDPKTFALVLRAMMDKFERDIRETKFAELTNKHFAASSIPKGIHCLSLRLTDEYSSNAHARRQLPSPERLPVLSDNAHHHFILSTDNILAASVVVSSAVQSSSNPERIVFHIITDKKTYAGMHSWFALNSVDPAIVEVRGVHQFDWLTRENVPVLEALESHNGLMNYYHGSHVAGANLSETTPRRFASRLQSRSPKYISLLNHLRIYIPELFPNLDKSSSNPERIVFHIITDKKTYAGMHSWFALNSVDPAIVEVRGVHQFDWLTRENVPVLEALESHNGLMNYYHGSHVAGANLSETTPRRFASRLQSRSPKYISLLNHLRIYIPELFPNLDKVVFLDDDVVVQRDLAPLWDVDLGGKVNGAVETCRGEDASVMSKRLRNYFNFSHPNIAKHLNPEECAWAYGMNVFDLKAWRKTNIRETYHSWLRENLKSNLTMWKLGTLPPALIAFKGHVHIIDSSWHMLGLGYQSQTNVESIRKAAVIHYNGQSKPWLEIGFEHLRPFWTKYVNYSNDFIKNCHILE
ncbi:hypothetical protein F2Q68_00022728 [Brassica cretica]|uniref:Hexosyltransferase n=1 Tax=Brassica cretica TaxID=69181 RepID=A0A8S9FVB5_BRACR|nr:hypothetical protein F2Q68_00022728 [Brassica cretica]